MKRLKNLFLAATLVVVILAQTGCMGSFSLTNSLYDWNKTGVSSKWGQELVFALLVIVPVYQVTLLADGIVLNAIEFWSGNNPLSMKSGEKESKIVQSGNDIYQITAEQNKVHVVKLGGENEGQTGDFVYNTEKAAWAFVAEGK